MPSPRVGSQLANLEVGGTKGKVLTTSVAQIHADFGLAVAAVKDVSYDVMDLDEAASFEASFQAFRRVDEHTRLASSGGVVARSGCGPMRRHEALNSVENTALYYTSSAG